MQKRRWISGMENAVSILALMLVLGCATDAPLSTSELLVPADLSATENGLREISIRWRKPLSYVDTYTIRRGTHESGPFKIVAEIDPSSCEYTDRGTPEAPLADATTYYYQIEARLKTRVPAPSLPVVTGRTAPPPQSPGLISIEAHVSRGVRLKWKKSPSLGVTGYVISRTRADKPASSKVIAKVATAVYVDGGTAESDLKDSTDYLYRIETLNRAGSKSKPAMFEKVTTRPAPAQVLGLAVRSREIRCVPITWKASPERDVVRYDIYRSGKKAGPFKKITSVMGRTSIHFLDGNTDPGNLADYGDYYYRIRAINAVTSESVDSDTVKATTREEPPVVEDVKVQSACPRRVPISWKVSPDEKVIGYEIWRSDKSGSFEQIRVIAGRHITEYVDRGLTALPSGLGKLLDAAEYSYKIIAFNYGMVRSSASKTVVARTKKRPDNLTGMKITTHLPHAIDITWNSSPEPDIVEYEVQVTADPTQFTRMKGVPGTPRTKAKSARESGLGDGVIRYYRVKAIDSDRLESDWSKVIKGRSKPLPAPPSGFKLQTVQRGGRKVVWTSPPQPDIREYVVWKKATFKWVLIDTTQKPEYVFLKSDLGKALTISVSAIDKDDLESPRSEGVAVPRSR